MLQEHMKKMEGAKKPDEEASNDAEGNAGPAVKQAQDKDKDKSSALPEGKEDSKPEGAKAAGQETPAMKEPEAKDAGIEEPSNDPDKLKAKTKTPGRMFNTLH